MDHIYYEDQWMLAFTPADVEKYKASGLKTFEEYVINTVMDFLKHLRAWFSTYAKVSFRGYKDEVYGWMCSRFDTLSELRTMVTEAINEVSTYTLKENFMDNVVNKGMILDVALSDDCINIENHNFYWEVTEEDVKNLVEEMIIDESKADVCIKTRK